VEAEEADEQGWYGDSLNEAAALAAEQQQERQQEEAAARMAEAVITLTLIVEGC